MLCNAESFITSGINIIGYAVLFLGAMILFRWVRATDSGRKALPDFVDPGYDFPAVTVLLPFISWISLTTIISLYMQKQFPHLKELSGNTLLVELTKVSIPYIIVANLVTIGLIIAVTRITLPGGIMSLGLKLKDIALDSRYAVINLLAIAPLIWIAANIVAGMTEMETHPSLEILQKDGSAKTLSLIVLNVVILGPILEELIFRGLIQTSLKYKTKNRWMAIGLSSFIFAMFHGNITHWPALFCLSCAFGYSYEKSGSLLRPMLMHTLFNCFNVSMVCLNHLIGSGATEAVK